MSTLPSTHLVHVHLHLLKSIKTSSEGFAVNVMLTYDTRRPYACARIHSGVCARIFFRTCAQPVRL